MQKNLEKLSYEDAVKKLEDIVNKLEEGDIPLEQSIKYFEEGTLLVNLCLEKLKKAEEKIRTLVETPEGELKLEDMSPRGQTPK